MKAKLALIHTSATLVPIFDQLCVEHLNGVERFHISDDSLIKDVIAKGSLTRETSVRVVDHVRSAASSGATQILVTCSSIGPAVELAQNFVSVPVIRVDLAMAEKAVTMGERIGVIATLPTTLEPTQDLVSRRAKAHHQSISLKPVLCEGAFSLLMSGRAEEHDAQVAEALTDLAKHVDVIVLAQASMARVADTLKPEEKPIPILASPELAILRLKETLQESA